MNMHGIIEPSELHAEERISRRERMLAWSRRNRVFLLMVVVPSLLLSGYLYLFASDQYESEAHFLVHSVDKAQVSAGGLGAMLGVAGGASMAQNDAMSVADYLTSHDVVDTLRRDDKFVERFNGNGIDLLSRLRTADPSPERLLKYYQKQVKVEFNTDTGITILRVHSFTPQDSYELARRLLLLGEQRVNEMNERSYQDAIALSQKQLAEAEKALADNQHQVTAYRQSRRDIDPKASGVAQIGLVTDLSGQLAAARSQLAAMAGFIKPTSPQYVALQARVSALSAQVAAQSGRLTGSHNTIAADMGGYESLRLRQDFLAKRYDAAAAALEHAREEALRQQLYVVRVVDANMPVKALYPERGRILATVVVTLLLIYSIGWLIAAGVREHAA
jgi:capsular polysaccharide transport system permease protein